MSQILKLFRSLWLSFHKVSVVRVPRSQNNHADLLAVLALSSDECIPQMIFIESLEQLSIERQTVMDVALVEESSWLDPYIVFLSNRSLSTDGKEAKKVQRMLTRFWLSEDKKLYRHSFAAK